MLGALAGDIIGSVYESRFRRIKTKDFPLFDPHCHFTDDSVLTVAVAQAILEQRPYLQTIRELGRNGINKEELRAEIERAFGYDLQRTVDGIRPSYMFDPSCQGTVPEAIIAFLDSTSWEDAARNAVSLGGDSDTLACITGAIAEAFYGPVPEPVSSRVQALLTSDLWDITRRFCARYVSDRTPSRQ